MELDKYENHQLITELRRRGLAIAAFSHEDVLAAQMPESSDDKNYSDAERDRAQEWLDNNRDLVEKAMETGGWNPISWAPDPVSADEVEEDEE